MFYVRIPPLDLKANPPKIASRYKFYGRVFEQGAQNGRWYGPYTKADVEGFRDQKVNDSPVFEVVAGDAVVGQRGGPTAEVLKDQNKTVKVVKAAKVVVPKKKTRGRAKSSGKDGRSSAAGKGA